MPAAAQQIDLGFATTEQTYGWAKVMRDGRTVCGRARVVIGRDLRRVGLTAPERRYMRIQFLERVARDLFEELDQIRRARGARHLRAVERSAPLTLVVEDRRDGHMELEVEVKLAPLRLPRPRMFALCEVEFDAREIPRAL